MKKLTAAFAWIMLLLVVPFVSGQQEQPIMAFDIHHAEKQSDLATIAPSKGWSVLPFDIKDLTMRHLAEKKVRLYLVSAPFPGYTAQELEELKTYVANGGSIVVQFFQFLGSALQERRAAARELTRQFGIDLVERVTTGYYSNRPVTTSISSMHPVLRGVNTIAAGIMWYSSYIYVAAQPPAFVPYEPRALLGLAQADQFADPLMAIFEDRSGEKVVVLPQLSSGSADNRVLLVNILDWVVSPDIKPPTMPAATQTVTVTVTAAKKAPITRTVAVPVTVTETVTRTTTATLTAAQGESVLLTPQTALIAAGGMIALSLVAALIIRRRTRP